MLLVDHDEAELVERHGLLDQRVRADDQMNRAAGELRQRLAPLRAASTLPVSAAPREIATGPAAAGSSGNAGRPESRSAP